MTASSNYQYVRELGRGAFGSVILARDVSSDSLVAVKKINRSQVQGYTESELVNHSMLRHPHIVKFHQVFLSPTNLNIVMEFVPDGSLLAAVQQEGKLPELTARWYFQQLTCALDYCHKKGVANRDIKLDNLLIDKSVYGRPQCPILKVCDWGYAKSEVLQSLATSRVGTLAYMAPEVLQANRNHYDGKAADIWSCGVVLYAMLVGTMPFRTIKTEQYPRMAMTLLTDMQQQRFTLPRHLTSAARDILQRLLNPNSVERITILEVFQHPWFTDRLPASALDMNDSYLKLPRNCLQSIEDIRAIVARATAADHQGERVAANLGPATPSS